MKEKKEGKAGKRLKRKILLGITAVLAVVAVIAVIKWKSATDHGGQQPAAISCVTGRPTPGVTPPSYG